MALWTDIIDPETLTGYARASMNAYEARKGTLARWLPNRQVPDIVASFMAGSNGLVEEAAFRAYDAEPKVGNQAPGRRVTLELPALGLTLPVSEYNQLRGRGVGASDEQILNSIQSATDAVVAAVSDAMERLRGIVLTTGKATIPGLTEDDFGRAGGHTVSAGILWSAGGDPIGDLRSWADTYIAANGEAPGAIVTSTKVMSTLMNHAKFQTNIGGGVSRPASLAEIEALFAGYGLPPFYVYDRRVKSGGSATRVIADTALLLLPAAVDPNAWQESDLGGTFWGRTLSSTSAEWDIADVDQPGIVAGVYRGEKPPMIAEIVGDAIGMPVLANADLSFKATVVS